MSTTKPPRVTMEVQSLQSKEVECMSILLGLYTIEEDESDLSKIEISYTSTYSKFEEAAVAGALKKIAKGHTKITEGYH